jgi:outer membrane protein assembly factor BamB
VKLNRLASISFLTVAPGFLLVAQMKPPAPPLHRASTVMLGGRADSPFVKGDIAWFGCESNVIAWDLKSSRELWKHTLDAGRHANNIAVDAGTVFVSADPEWEKTSTALIALDAGTGKPTWSLPRTGRSSAIGVGDGVIYTELAPFHISAIQGATERSAGPRN